MTPRYLVVCASITALMANAQIQLVKDFGLNPVDPFPKDLTASGSLLFFTGYDAAHGWELWASDGTAVGTQMVKDINPGTTSSLFQSWYTDVEGVLFFAADDGVNGAELWKSDGTEAGTVMVKDIDPGAEASNPSFMIHYDTGVLFAAYNGSDVGTQLVVADFSPYATRPAIMNGIAYFNAYVNSIGNYTLWKTNGTNLLTEAVLPPSSGGPGPCFGLTASDNLVYFTSSDPDHGNELWRSDGYGLGTAVVDINPGSAESYVRNITTIGDTAYFHATNGVDGNGFYRFRPGQAPEHISTVMPLFDGSPQWPYMVAMNEIIYFVGYEPATGTELYKSDGTTAGTVMVKDIEAGMGNGLGELSNLKVVGDSLYFLANTTASGMELWVSDGTEAGTHMVQDRYLGAGSFMPMELTQVGNNLYMRGNIYDQADQLFRLDLSGGSSGMEAQTAATLKVWPVPGNGSFQLSGALPGASFRLLAVTGRSASRSFQQGGTFHLDTTAPAGTYLLIVEEPRTMSTTLRVVIE
jgi:ELWxxDGT repeat protein